MLEIALIFLVIATYRGLKEKNFELLRAAFVGWAIIVIASAFTTGEWYIMSRFHPTTSIIHTPKINLMMTADDLI
jgi:hypothetical protein